MSEKKKIGCEKCKGTGWMPGTKDTNWRETPCSFCNPEGIKVAAHHQELGLQVIEEAPDDRRHELELVRKIGALSPDEWPDERIVAIRQMFATEARTLGQLAMFLHIQQSVGLSAALGEIWLIQTNKGPKTYSGRDGFLKSASRFEGTLYGGIESGVVYAEDEFRVEYKRDPDTGVQGVFITHTWSPMERKSQYPHGSYAVAYDAKGRPTFVYREFDKCKQMKSTYWKQHGDDAIHNRAVAGALRRVVPLGGLMIEGEVPIGDTDQTADFVGRSTSARLGDLAAQLKGEQPESGDLEEAEFSVLEDDGHPPIDDLRKALDMLTSKHRLPDYVLQTWAEDSTGFPDDPAAWEKDHLIIAAQEIQASEGLDMLKVYARLLAEGIKDDDERIRVHNEIIVADRKKLDKLINRLAEMS